MSFKEAVERRIRERGFSPLRSPSPEYLKAVERRVRPPITEVEKAMLAREIRAEGTFYYPAHFPYWRKYRRCHYVLRIAFVDADKAAAEDIYKLLSRYGKPFLRWVEMTGTWTTGLEGLPAKRVLEDILPYMVGVKKEAADMAIKYPAYIRCEDGRPPLPRVGRPPLAEHSPRGKLWVEFFRAHHRYPTREEWEEIRRALKSWIS